MYVANTSPTTRNIWGTYLTDYVTCNFTAYLPVAQVALHVHA